MIRKFLAVFLSVGMFATSISAQDFGLSAEKIGSFIDKQIEKQDPLRDISITFEKIELPEYQYEPAVVDGTYRRNPVREIVENSDNLPMGSKYYITSHLEEIDADYTKSHEWLKQAIQNTSNNRELEYKLVIKHLQGDFKYISQNKIAQILATNEFSDHETQNISDLLLKSFNHEEFGYPNPDDVGRNVFYSSALMSNTNAEGIDNVINAVFDVLENSGLDSKLEAIQALMIAEFSDDKKPEIAARVENLISEYDDLQYEKNQSFIQELGLFDIDYTTNQRQAEFFMVWNLDKALTKVDWLIMGQSWEKKPGENQVEGAGFFGEDDAMQYSDSGLKHYILKYLVMTFVKNASQSETNNFIEEHVSISKTSSGKYKFNHYVLTAWYGLEALNVVSQEDLSLIKSSMKAKLKKNLKLVLGIQKYQYITNECWFKFGLAFLVEDILIEGVLFPLIGIVRINAGFRAIGKYTFKISKWIVGPKLITKWQANKVFTRAVRQNSKKPVEILASAQEIVAKIKNEAHIFNYGKPFVDNFNMYQKNALKSGKVVTKVGKTRALNSYFRDFAKAKTVRAGQYRVPYQTKEMFEKFLKCANKLGLTFNVAEKNMLDIIGRNLVEMNAKTKGMYSVSAKLITGATVATPIAIIASRKYAKNNEQLTNEAKPADTTSFQTNDGKYKQFEIDPATLAYLKAIEKEEDNRTFQEKVEYGIDVVIAVVPPLLTDLFDTKAYEMMDGIERGVDGIRNNEEIHQLINGYKADETEEKSHPITEILDNYLGR